MVRCVRNPIEVIRIGNQKSESRQAKYELHGSHILLQENESTL